jgi:hypothetical protein
VRDSLFKLPQFRLNSTEIASFGERCRDYEFADRAIGSRRACASDSEITESQFLHGTGI